MWYLELQGYLLDGLMDLLERSDVLLSRLCILRETKMHVLLTDINELEKRIKRSHREVRTSTIPQKKPQTFCLLRRVKLQQTCQFHQVATSPVKSGLLQVVICSTDEDPSLRIESSAIINLRAVSTKLKKFITTC